MDSLRWGFAGGCNPFRDTVASGDFTVRTAEHRDFLELRNPTDSLAPMTVRETIQRAAARLESAGIEFARLDAEWLLAHAMNARRMRMISEPSRVVDAGALSRFEELLKSFVLNKA